MAQASFSSLGSGIDFSVITEATISTRSRPIIQLAAKQASFRSRVDGLKQLNAKLITFSEAANKLSDKTLGDNKLATSSTSTVLTASASTSAANGNFNVEVIRLASSLSQASNSFSSNQSPILANGATNATFELRKGGASSGTVITINENNNSLAALRDAINNANAGVSAQIIDVSGDGTQNQLVLNSTETGSAGRVELVETSSTGTQQALNLRNLNPATGNFSQLDSEIKVAAFVDAFNDVQDFINTQFKTDDKGRTTGVLASDTTLRIVQQELRSVVNKVASNNGGSLNNLTEIGITRDAQGKLTIDQDTLNNKLSDSLADVQALFAGKSTNQIGLSSSFKNIGDNLKNSLSEAITGFDNSIKNIDKSIVAQQERLSALRISLTRQFAAVDAAIGQLNGQNSALSGVLKSLEPKQQ